MNKYVRCDFCNNSVPVFVDLKKETHSIMTHCAKCKAEIKVQIELKVYIIESKYVYA